MTITHINMPVELLKFKNLCHIQRYILALVISFKSKGLKMTNESLADVFGRRPDYISKLISELEAKGYIRVVNSQSKYRIIYLAENCKVKDNLLSNKSLSKDVLLSSFSQSTLHKTTNISKRSKENITNAFGTKEISEAEAERILAEC